MLPPLARERRCCSDDLALRHQADEYELNVGQSAQRLADGQIDAFFYAAGTPLSALIQPARQRDLILQLSAEEQTINGIIPYYVQDVITWCL